VCYCDVPLDEERPYWEEFFELVRVQDAHGRHRCRDLNGTEPWACCECDCTERLEARMSGWGEPFLDVLRRAASAAGQRSHLAPRDDRLSQSERTTLTRDH
jgi:hypothetical protein